MNYEVVLENFKKFLEKFDSKESMINMKVSHSYHVVGLASILAKRLNLEEEKVVFAKVLGLLHDLGRFYQYQETKEYNDLKTKMDHARTATEYLFQEKYIENFNISKKYYKILEKAIFNHNKLEIESGLTKEELFWAKFIRDIDKIDILRVCGTNFSLAFDEPVSKKVKTDFDAHTLVNRENIKNSSDTIISYLAFLYDLNFKESYLLLEETDNLELFIGSIEVVKGLEEEFNDYVNSIRAFLKEKVQDE